jgi:hypothetical protein
MATVRCGQPIIARAEGPVPAETAETRRQEACDAEVGSHGTSGRPDGKRADGGGRVDFRLSGRQSRVALL